MRTKAPEEKENPCSFLSFLSWGNASKRDRICSALMALSCSTKALAKISALLRTSAERCNEVELACSAPSPSQCLHSM